MQAMKTFHAAAGFALALALIAGAYAAEPAIKSGPQKGEKLAGPFHPLNINGAHAGEKNCLYCENGENPVVMIFAREGSPALAKLIKQVDAATVKNAGASMGSFVVFLSDKDGLEKELKEMAKGVNLQKTVLAIDNPAGPKGYNVAAGAEVTVVLYKNHTVMANHAFAKGKLDDKAIETIIGEIPALVK
jgi:hypothetical protein